MLDWTTIRACSLAHPGCSKCHGTGRAWRPAQRACNCVAREIFRVCWQRQIRGGAVPTLAEAEYAADLVLTARRELGELDWQIFRLHFVEGLNCVLACRRLRIDRGMFFHRVYRIEEILGTAWAGLRPYALYPPGEYFVQRRAA